MAWVTAGAVVVVAAGGLVAWRTVRVLRRRVAVEEARGLLMDATSHRDRDALHGQAETLRYQVEAMHSRLVAAMAEQEALSEAFAELIDAEWARYAVTERRDTGEGGQA